MKAKMLVILLLVFASVTTARQVTVKGKTNEGAFGPPPAALSLNAELVVPSGGIVLDAGQRATLKVTVTNTGGSPAENVTARLVPSKTLVGLNFSPTVLLGNIAQGRSSIVRFELAASEAVATDEVAFTVEAYDSKGVRAEPQKITIATKAKILLPILAARVQLSEPSGNGFLDAGETGAINVTISNSGGSVATNVVARSFIPSAIVGLTVKDTVQVGDIAPNASKVAAFKLSTSGTARSQNVSVRIEGVDQSGVRFDPISVPVSIKEIIIARDETPPVIELTEPEHILSRGIRILPQEHAISTTHWSVRIKGNARDSGGVAIVWVNDFECRLIPVAGAVQFEAEPMLSLGLNTIEIKAVDKSKNESKLVLNVKREVSFVTGKYYALVIAVQDYVDNSINSLEYPVSDAQKVISVLTERYTFDPKNITLLKSPDRRAIFRAFEALRSQLTENDNLIIFYAGHGIWDEGMRQGYWLPSNATAADPSEWIPNSTIRDYIRGIKSKHTLLVADACFSGGIFRTRDAFAQPDVSIQKVYEMPSRRAVTSGAMKTVPDRSVFAEYLVKRLRENTEPYLYTMRLYINMKDAVTNNSPGNQTPLYGVINEAGDEGGDFVFVRR